MTTQDFSNEFDTLLNSYSDKGISIQLNEYEKSVLLTEAQEDIAKELYTGRLMGVPVEKTEELRRCLDGLIKTARLPIVKKKESREGENDSQESIADKYTLFELPKDVWFITYESALVEDGKKDKNIMIIPARQDEWHRAKYNPFRQPNARKIIRLDNGSNISELVSEYNIKEYIIRYISTPPPIILTDLNGITIRGESKESGCVLNSLIHRTILDRAVQMAITRMSYVSQPQSNNSNKEK